MVELLSQLLAITMTTVIYCFANRSFLENFLASYH